MSRHPSISILLIGKPGVRMSGTADVRVASIVPIVPVPTARSGFPGTDVSLGVSDVSLGCARAVPAACTPRYLPFDEAEVL